MSLYSCVLQKIIPMILHLQTNLSFPLIVFLVPVLCIYRFYAALASNLKNRYKVVHAPAAEVVGMSLKQMAEKDKV